MEIRQDERSRSWIWCRRRLETKGKKEGEFNTFNNSTFEVQEVIVQLAGGFHVESECPRPGDGGLKVGIAAVSSYGSSGTIIPASTVDGGPHPVDNLPGLAAWPCGGDLRKGKQGSTT